MKNARNGKSLTSSNVAMAKRTEGMGAGVRGRSPLLGDKERTEGWLGVRLG